MENGDNTHGEGQILLFKLTGYFLVSQGIFSKVSDTGYRTDHSAVMLNFKTNESKRGREYWTFNSQLLFKKEYTDKERQLSMETVEEYMISDDKGNLKRIEFHISDQLFWEVLKMKKKRSMTIEYLSAMTRKAEYMYLILKRYF